VYNSDSIGEITGPGLFLLPYGHGQDQRTAHAAAGDRVGQRTCLAAGVRTGLLLVHTVTEKGELYTRGL